jgi:hypothetical protein
MPPGSSRRKIRPAPRRLASATPELNDLGSVTQSGDRRADRKYSAIGAFMAANAPPAVVTLRG